MTNSKTMSDTITKYLFLDNQPIYNLPFVRVVEVDDQSCYTILRERYLCYRIGTSNQRHLSNHQR